MMDGGAMGVRPRSYAALAAAVLVILQLPLPANGSSELFKTSNGDTAPTVRIEAGHGYNDSLSFTLPVACSVQSARFELTASAVYPAAGLNDTGQRLLDGAQSADLVMEGGALRLADERRAFEFSSWQSYSGCMTASLPACLTLARDLSRTVFTPDVRPGPSDQSEFEPAVAIGAGDLLCLAWSDMRDFDYNVYFTRSLDLGATFQNAMRINDDSGTKKTRQEHVDIAVGPGSSVFLVWDDNRSGDSDIYLARSRNGGASFEANIRVDDSPQGTNQSYPSVAVMASGAVAVAWEDDRSGVREIRCAVSDAALRFGPSVQVNSDSSGLEHFRPRLAAGPAALHAVWYDNRSGNFSIYYARYSGSGFAADVRVDDSADASFQALPSLAVGPQEKVHVVWHDTRYGSFRVFYASTQDGLTFSPNIQVNQQAGAGKSQYQPRIRRGGDGVLHVVWHDYRNGEPDIYYANSTSGGSSFNPPVRADHGAIEVLSYSPALDIDSRGQVHVAWWDNRTRQQGYGYNYQVFYSRGLHPFFPSGSYETAALDLGIGPSALLEACCTAESPLDTVLKVMLRTAPQAGGPWTEYEVVGYCATRDYRPASMPGRLVQWRLELSTALYDAAPAVSLLALDYAVHLTSGSLRSRPVTYPYPLRGASVNWLFGTLGEGDAHLTLELSANNGSSWAEARPGMPVQFAGNGRVLVYRLSFEGTSSSTPFLSGLSIDLRMESLPSDVQLTVGRSTTHVWSLPGTLPPADGQLSPELGDAFNRAVQEAKKAGKDSAIIKLNISSATPGELRLGAIRILYDLPPELVRTTPERAVSVDEGGELAFGVESRDLDDEELSLRWTLDGGLVQAGGGAYVYRPEHTESGAHNLTVSASDGVLSASYSWLVLVRDVNRPPVVERASPECRTALLARANARFEVRAIDPDGDLLTYNWYAGGNAVSTGQDYFDFTAPAEAGEVVIAVNISDGRDSSSHSWTVSVATVPSGNGDEPVPEIGWQWLAGAMLLAVAGALGARLLLERRRARGRRAGRRRRARRPSEGAGKA